MSWTWCLDQLHDLVAVARLAALSSASAFTAALQRTRLLRPKRSRPALPLSRMERLEPVREWDETDRCLRGNDARARLDSYCPPHLAGMLCILIPTGHKWSGY